MTNTFRARAALAAAAMTLGLGALAEPAQPGAPERLSFGVTGMTCAALCEASVAKPSCGRCWARWATNACASSAVRVAAGA